MREWKPHSYEKISILGDYIGQFAKASQGAVNRVYIDAFAGDTVNVLKGSDQQFPGSAQLALGASPAFTHVRLFEKNLKRARSLRDLSPPPGSSFEVVEGDSNAEMARVLGALPVQAPTFAFLDPDGMELNWSTMRRIADHKRAYAKANQKSKVEMWVLFSSGGIVRMLGSNRQHAESQRFPEMVARLYGAWVPGRMCGMPAWMGGSPRAMPSRHTSCCTWTVSLASAISTCWPVRSRTPATSCTSWCSRLTPWPAASSCAGPRSVSGYGQSRARSSTWPNPVRRTKTSTPDGATTSRSPSANGSSSLRTVPDGRLVDRVDGRHLEPDDRL